MGMYLAVELLGHRVYICAVSVDISPKVSQPEHTNSHSYQRLVRVLIAPQPYRHLVLSVLFNVGIWVDFIILYGVLEVEPFPQPPKPETLNFATFMFRNALCTEAGDYIGTEVLL